MIIFTPVWGEPYMSWFQRGLLTSLQWPLNAEAIKDARWEIFTSATYAAYLQGVSLPIEKNVRVTATLMDSLLFTIEMCLKEDRPMLMATPDFIFSDGTINTFKRVGNRKGICVAIPNVRVLPTFLQHIRPHPHPTQYLVKECWNHLHESWTGAQLGASPSSSYMSGVIWRELEDKSLIAVQHRLPSTFFANFLPQDLDYFKKNKCFNYWDTYWPGDCLLDRQRLIGSSDAAFLMELTEPGNNVPSYGAGPEVDSYHMECPHNKINRQFVSIFRR